MKYLAIIILALSTLISCNVVQKADENTQTNNENTVEKKSQEPDLAMELVQKTVNIEGIIGQKLFWIQTLYNNDTKVHPKKDIAYIIFEHKDKLSIQTDCNLGRGSYSVKEKTISMQVLQLTKIACLESTESIFLKDLNRASVIFQIANKIFIDLEGHSGTMEFEIRKK